MKSVFISCNLHDEAKANVVVGELSKQGIIVLRPNEFSPGSDWQANLLSDIHRCSVFLAVIAEQPASNVMFELGYALGTRKRVILLGHLGARVPSNLAALPMFRFNEYDLSTLIPLTQSVLKLVQEEVLPRPRTGNSRSNLESLLRNSDQLDRMSPMDFEVQILGFLNEVGFEAKAMPPWHDGGYDMVATDPSSSVITLVEVKKSRPDSVLGLAPVRQLIGAVALANAASAMLITTSRFSPSALAMAQKAPRPILLLSLEELISSTKESLNRKLDAVKTPPANIDGSGG